MSDDVERYFTLKARSFDRLYDLPPAERLLNKVFRRAVYQRFDLTFQHAGDVRGKRVLDIGCGSGRYAVEFARRGADVVGVDFAEDMLALARSYAREAGVEDQVRFERADFASFGSERPFDIAIAIGFFDYILDPLSVLQRIRAVTSGRLLASFPADRFLRSALRRRRYARGGVQLRFYDHAEIASLARQAGFGRVDVVPLSAGHFLIADARDPM